MKSIYILGHGVMSQKTDSDTLLLKHKLYTYCQAGAMLEGGQGVSSIIDTGTYSPKHPSSVKVAQAGEFAPFTQIDMHYAYGGNSTMADLKGCAKFQAVKSQANKNKIVLANRAGELLPIGDNEFIYFTQKTTMTSLAYIQLWAAQALPAEKLAFHWVACRSYIAGRTNHQRLKYVQDFGADGGVVLSILR